MLSLPNDGRYPVLELTPQQRRQRTMDALVRQVEILSGLGPLLVVFEDAHWADPTSLELMGRLASHIASHRVLMVISFRPEFEAPWIEQAHVTALALSRLAPRDVDVMIDHIIGNNPLPAAVRQDIIERTDGIPLFVEEMTKAVLETTSEDEAHADRRLGSPFGDGRAGKPARIVDGAARPTRRLQRTCPDRSGDRPRILA